MTKKISHFSACICLLRENGDLLMQHRDNNPDIHSPNIWGFPSGRIHEGETAIECAKRELQEETDYLCEDLLFLASFIDDYIEGWPPCHNSVFWAIYDGIQPLTCYEGQELKFIPYEQKTVYSVPWYLVKIWDQALSAAGVQLP